MLHALELNDFAIVDTLRVELSDGLNVLTGETGAGKSILIDALAQLIGNRADSSMIRAGSPSALIQGFFTTGENELSVSRRLAGNGRSSARLNGEVVTISELAENGARLVAIHGQHASQTLMDSAEQRRLLDAQLPAQAQQTLTNYRAQYGRYQTLSDELEALTSAARERERRLDMLRYQVDEIKGARLHPDEEAALETQLQSLRHAERIVQAAGGAVNTLSEAEPSALSLVAEAQRQLAGGARYHPTLETLAKELDEAMSSVQAIAEALELFLADFEVEPGRLEQLEARAAQLDKLKLKYGESVAAVLAFGDEAARELDALEHAEERGVALEAEREALRQELTTLAATLSEARARSGKRLAQAVTKEVQRLGMSKASLEVTLEPLPALAGHGRDRVSFVFSANLGEPPAPLAAVASGGELSRLMLALNVVTGSDLPTLAFDEVDAGIGGQTARMVGALLKTLARRHQVLVVTHLPQVAAFADAHFFVEKQERAGRTVTRVTPLNVAAREAELARMLSGSVTPTALAHARELLAEAQATVLS